MGFLFPLLSLYSLLLHGFESYSNAQATNKQTKLHNQLAIPHFLNRSQRSCLAPAAGAACHYAAHKHPVAPAASAAQPTAQAEPPAPEEAALLEPAGKGLAADLAVADGSEQQAVQQKAQQDGEKLEQQQQPAVGAAAPTEEAEEALPGAQLNTAGPGSEAPAASA